MKQYMKLIIDDQPVQEARMANARKKHDRGLLLDLWADCGKVRLLDENQHVVRVLVGDQIFEDRRSEYPSEGLIARVQLALHAGLTCQNDKLDRPLDDAVDAMRYSMLDRGKRWANSIAATVTATVKPRRPRP